MVDRAHVLERAQWAFETTPGTGVAADKAVRSMTVTLGIEGEVDSFRPDGEVFGTLFAPSMEWTSFRAEGRPTYPEILYPLESLCGAPTITTVGTTGKKRVYTIGSNALTTAKTLTIEKGSSIRAAKITYGLFTELGLAISRKGGVTMTGGGMGQLLTDGITLTGSPTKLPQVPILGKQFNVYLDSTSAALGTTKMLRAFSLEPQINGLYGPVWPIDSAQPSFAGHVELAPGATFRLRLEADAAGLAYLSQYRSGDLIFVRAEAIGPEFESGQTYKFTEDLAFGIKRVTDFGADEDGVTVVNFETELATDATWGKALSIAVTTAVATV